jgi:predicted acetyltransferase
VELLRPATEHVASYIAALERGWSPDTENPDASRIMLDRLRSDQEAFLRLADDPEGAGPPVTLPDGTQVKRIPGYLRWIWDGEFAGSINLRWQPGTTELPPTCLGHIGYAVVPWRQRRGYATEALGAMLPLARKTGLPWVAITTDVDNIASEKVITANGGIFVHEFTKPEALGGGVALLYRIALS